MKQSKIIALCLLAVIAVLLWWLTRSPKVSLRPAAQSEEAKVPRATSAPAVVNTSTSTSPSFQTKPVNQALEQVTRALNAPIAFYGRVIDQYGNPVSDADVGYTAADKFNASGSNYSGKSDEDGLFEISGIKGAGLLVGVGKRGYYPVEGKSSASFAYGVGRDSYRQLAPTKAKPAIFLLHKMGETEPLVHVSARQYKVGRNGQPMEIVLDTGKQVSVNQGDIRFERWTNDQAKNARGHFDWRFRITAPFGIIERLDQFAFEAPQEGYHDVVEIDMSALLGDRWSYTVNRSYFVKSRKGKYARVNVSIYGGHNNSLVLESFVNPNHNSRNLEFDPTNVCNLDP